MLRNSLKDKAVKNADDSFRFRGVDNTRIEALSDGVFAIATALLIISSSIPETYKELMVFVGDLVPFAICMVLLMVIWYQHYLFFIRYGFKDSKIVAVNTLLLFLILFYVYPLKFLFKLLYNMWSSGIAGDREKFNYLFTEVILVENTPTLMLIYGIGAAGIFLTLAWMYSIAYNRRTSLELTPIETFDTKTSMMANFIMAIIPIGSIIISQTVDSARSAFTLSGMFYMIYPLVMIPFGRIFGKKRKQLLESLE